MRHVPHRCLDFLTLLAKLFAGAINHQANNRQDRHQHQRQFPVHPKQISEKEDHRHSFAENHFDGIRRSASNHRSIERNPRYQMAGVVVIEVLIRQGKEVIEQCSTKIVDYTQRHFGQKIIT